VPGRDEALDVFALSLIVPLPGQERNSIVFEERDGSNIEQFTAKSIEVEVAGKRAGRVSEAKITAFVTDARLAFACSKFNDSERLSRPGEWPEQLLKVGMKTFAAVRRHRRMLVGQVPTGVAAEIARRAAAYRLASEPGLTDDQRAALTALTEAATQTHEEKNKIEPHTFPHFWNVGEESARFVPVTAQLTTPEPVDGTPA
jgi:hypothetical protein